MTKPANDLNPNKRIEQLEETVDQLTWLLAELLAKQRAAAVIDNKAKAIFQQRLEDVIINSVAKNRTPRPQGVKLPGEE